eukprot:Rhum_TRINITY_DN15457_c5_g5::Rhum_TRINITY_DN15457_c5_g5_i3::g.159685::m.159685
MYRGKGVCHGASWRSGLVCGHGEERTKKRGRRGCHLQPRQCERKNKHGRLPPHAAAGALLVLLDILLALDVGGLGAHLLVVLLEGRQVLTRLGELTLLHALADVPVHERTLRVHQVELVVDAREHLRDRRRVRDHAHRALHLREVATRHHRRRLVVDTALETGRGPVHELDRALRLDRGHGRVHVLGHDVTAVHQAAGHVLAVARVALGHHRGGLERGVRDLRHRQLLVVRLLRRDHRRVRRQHEVDTRVRHQVGLELRHVDVQGTVETERRRQRRDHLGDQPVQVRVRRPLDVEVPARNVVDRLVVEHAGDVRVLKERVRRQHAVVRLHDGRRHLRRGVHSKTELRLAAVVDRQTLEQQRSETGARASADGVEHEEALQTRAVV